MATTCTTASGAHRVLAVSGAQVSWRSTARRFEAGPVRGPKVEVQV